MNGGIRIRTVLAAFVLGIAVASCAEADASGVPAEGALAVGPATVTGDEAARSAASTVAAIVGAPKMTVYATPTCGCCGGWVDHVRDHGFEVELIHQDDLSDIRKKHRLPDQLLSCHMGVVEGFAVEGHVPASVIHRLLAERPEVLGIAAPGMPAGSPGMEMPNGFVQAYDVVSYDDAGRIRVFESIR